MKDYGSFKYKENITVVTTPKGDKVITMNDAVFMELRNAIYDSATYCEEHKLGGTQYDRMVLWQTLVDGNKQSEK